MPHSRSTPRAGFTLVEMLVVISVITILISIVLTGVSKSRQTAIQTKSLSGIKQVAVAWQQYSNQNDDRAMIGYMDEGVQAAFKVKIRDRAGDRVAPEFCKTYPFRLLPYLDHDRQILYDYGSEDQLSTLPNDVIASTPAFGYNAYYLGGWWTTDTATGTPKMKFAATGYYRSSNQLVPGEMVARSINQIERKSDMIVFASSYAAEPGFLKNPDQLAPGSAWVVPHRRGMTDIWAASDGATFNNISTASLLDGGSPLAPLAALLSADSGAVPVQGGIGLDVFVAESVPLRRVKNTVVTVRADLSTEAQGLRDLMNQTRWMNNASQSSDQINFSHPE
jgi:prepilin-type N-terminal cleavage/methylation domain-containing protein